jgi:hypothetical protein
MCVCAVCFFFPVGSFAQGNTSAGAYAWQDAALGSVMRFMAIEMLNRLDYDGIRAQKSQEIRTWSDDQFAQYYAQAWPLISNCRVLHGFRAGMTKQEFAGEVARLTKPKAVAMINSIPDETIVREFRKETARLKDKIPQGSIDQQISWLLKEAERSLKE